MKLKNLFSWVEYSEKKHPHCLSFGSKAPWMNRIQITIPKWLVAFVMKLIK